MVLKLWTVNAEVKHAFHVVCFMTFILWFEHDPISFLIWVKNSENIVNPYEKYGYFQSTLLYLLSYASLLSLPSCICATLGLVMFNSFKEEVILKRPVQSAPFICIRVVTRGNYRELVKSTVAVNIQTCKNVGMDNFILEVVTGKELNLRKRQYLREIVVPDNYESKSGSMFKARKLQYCLEDGVNQLKDDDWIVHLDEESLLTENSLRGILNFCMDGQHPFGQGVITYASGDIVNWVTTFAESSRVADNWGRRRLLFEYLHKPVVGWHGSFMVMRVGAERSITFDHGPDGSIAEDYCFSSIAFRDGYSFNYIEGEIHEQSTFTIWDFLQQRKRWFNGIFLVLYSIDIQNRIKAILLVSYLEWVMSPLMTLNILLSPLFPVPHYSALATAMAYVKAVSLYVEAFGIFKLFSNRYQDRPWQLLFFMSCSMFMIPVNMIMSNVAILYSFWCLLSRSNMYQFYVVKK